MDSDYINSIEKYVNEMGYNLTDYGKDMITYYSDDFNAVEIACHIVITAIAFDIKDADLDRVLEFLPNGFATLELFKQYKDNDMMREDVWSDFSGLLAKIIIIDENQEKAIGIALSGPAGVGRLAVKQA